MLTEGKGQRVQNPAFTFTRVEDFCFVAVHFFKINHVQFCDIECELFFLEINSLVILNCSANPPLRAGGIFETKVGQCGLFFWICLWGGAH